MIREQLAHGTILLSNNGKGIANLLFVDNLTIIRLANRSSEVGWIYSGVPCKALRRRWVEE